MKVLISGSSGFVGSALREQFQSEGIEYLRLVRYKEEASEPNCIFWSPEGGILDAKEIEGCDAVVNLAGENIASGRWTPERKREIRDSRVQSTLLLSETIAKMKSPPKVMISGSAIGFYGERSEPVTEEAEVGDGFLADVCADWEDATEAAEKAGVRVVHLRIGVVLDPDGGAIKRMLLPFQFGLGGRLGSGKQMMSWVTRDDLCRIIVFCLRNEEMKGPVNATAPRPISNGEFTDALGNALHRPTVFPVPAFVLKFLLGEMAEEMLLTGAPVVPEKLLKEGYSFQYPEIQDALNSMLSS